ncbi:hypothetical protein ACFHW2_20320 [Actinomadura sp. LOL_016]|uniref:hypothetical protein n=1 Tax=unclassified Actinomadura TaxID=2626254 RepID=UPI003A811A2F
MDGAETRVIETGISALVPRASIGGTVIAHGWNRHLAGRDLDLRTGPPVALGAGGAGAALRPTARRRPQRCADA